MLHLSFPLALLVPKALNGWWAVSAYVAGVLQGFEIPALLLSVGLVGQTRAIMIGQIGHVTN